MYNQLIENEKNNPTSDKKSTNQILISSDEIFSSNIEGFQKYTPILHIEYRLYKSFLYGENLASAVMLNAEEVSIDILSGCHCAMLIGRMAKSIVIPNITIVKILTSNSKNNITEKKEFKNCVIQSFKMQDNLVNFSFRYSSFKDEYKDFKLDGMQKGNAAVQVDLIKWKVENT